MIQPSVFPVTPDKPTPPQGPVDVLECSPGSVAYKWKPPKDDGGSPITSYILERQQVGRNKWTVLGEVPGGTPSYRDSDVDPGRRYCYRIRAKSSEGISEFLETEDIAAGVLRESACLFYRVLCYGVEQAGSDSFSLQVTLALRVPPRWSVPSRTAST